MASEDYWSVVWQQFKKSKTGIAALCLLSLFFIIGLYAPLLASSKPLLVLWEGALYFPLLRYLFYPGFYTKPIDLFFNLMMLTLPFALAGFFILKRRKKIFLITLCCAHFFLFIWILSGVVKNPVSDTALIEAKRKVNEANFVYCQDPLLAPFPMELGWSFDVKYLSLYTKLNQLIEYQLLNAQHLRLNTSRLAYAKATGMEMPTLWHVLERNETTQEETLRKSVKDLEKTYAQARTQLPQLMDAYRPYSHSFIMAKYILEHASSDSEKAGAENHLQEAMNQAYLHRAALDSARHTIQHYQKDQAQLLYLSEKKEWLKHESKKLRILIPPLIRAFHWEEDAGGAQEANRYVPWWELTRVNRKDLVASLLFGTRVSIMVGTLAIALALLIGIPLGSIAGYFAGKTDLVVCRIIEMWEAMPTFFMLLLVVAITQSKSLFLVITVLGVFGWTSFARFIRSEFLKQRQLPYVEACKSLGLNSKRIMFSHIFPNAIPPVLTLLPFAMMAAITSEAGLSFLGLGEEGSASWGVLMDEGRSAFPAESYLLWPPAILLTLLLISIALVGDALRDAIDPKMRQ